ncbi:glycosyltransferase family 2 protein [Algoriphagus limi]|uniref:Glycosyltransferase family 2 protein n=1 Tax=Algoriphagus limi TaxID=2975273 RepID=A0ABT2G742_9BACT|nr:glycosyltransferase family 2 protein [Algoriphagus limi]MCS5491105.1 glycosyltransferase family 2 protein [Algoriphagus limi]
MEILFWILLGIILYTFLGYGMIITLLAKIKGRKNSYSELEDEDLPSVTLVVAAYNEEEIIDQKVKNCLALSYPKDKLKILFVTDGSTDRTVQYLEQYAPQIHYAHSPARRGKIAAINRVMPSIDSQITIFCDANVMLNPEAIRLLANPFQSNLVAAVSGEKVVRSGADEGASSSGEGAYWKYESFLKKMDAQWNTLVGSAGELIALRTIMYQPMEEDTIIEDFVMTLRLAESGYKVSYVSEAKAVEYGSASVAEEEKRKVRISAGGIQAINRLSSLWKVWNHPGLSFQYFSHRVIRWTLMPLALLLLIPANVLLWDHGLIYQIILLSQLGFYSLVILGYQFRERKTKKKWMHLPFYFIFMHICVIKGWFRYAKGKQAVTWEKAKRLAISE